MNQKKLTKKRNGKFLGVCAGVADYFEIDPTVVRSVWAVFSIVGAGVLAYFVLYFIMPYDDEIGNY